MKHRGSANLGLIIDQELPLLLISTDQVSIDPVQYEQLVKIKGTTNNAKIHSLV